MTEGANLKYACIESERRFVLSGFPRLWRSSSPSTVRDRYIRGTRLRFRTVDAPGGERIWKLGQKVPLGTSPGRVAHTSIYLNAVEAGVFGALPADELTKLRRILTVDGRSWSLDEFRGSLEGLVLIETDLGDNHATPIDPPFRPAFEVTNDERFTGGALAALPSGALAGLLKTL